MPRSSVRTSLPQIAWPKPSMKKVMPMVAANQDDRRLVDQRPNTMRSMTSTIVTPVAMTNASQGLTPKSSIRPAKNSAANRPWRLGRS